MRQKAASAHLGRGFSRVPLPLSVVQQGAGSELAPQSADEFPDRMRFLWETAVKFHPVRPGRRSRRRWVPAHGETDILPDQIGIYGGPEGVHPGPLILRVGLGDPGIVDATDAHLVVQGGFAPSTAPVTGAALEGSGVQDNGMCPSPASSPDVGSNPIQPAPGRVHLAPGVKISEIHLGSARAVEGLHVGGELDEVAADKTGGEAEMPQHLNEQPSGIPAGSAGKGPASAPGLDAGFQANDIPDVPAGAAG